MLNEAIGAILPAAVAVALSPIPIIAIVLVLGSSHARTSGPAFAAGWVLGLTAVSIVVVQFVGGASDPTSDTATGVNWALAALGIALLVMAGRQWRKRPKDGEEPEMPAWMATVDEIAPGKAFVLGVALSAANPKNLALTAAAAARIAQAGLDDADTAIAVGVFVIIGSITVAGAVLAYLVAPSWAEKPLASIRQFMSDHNAAIMMVILLILGVKVLGDAIPAL